MTKYEELIEKELALMGKAIEVRDKALVCAEKLIAGEDRDGKPLSVEQCELLVKKFNNFRKRGVKLADEALLVGFESVVAKGKGGKKRTKAK